MGLFSKTPSNSMEQWAIQHTNDEYRRHKGEINAFLGGLSAQDKAYFNGCVDEITNLTLPYEGAVSYPTALVAQMQAIGNKLHDRFDDNRPLQYAFYIYAIRAPQFSGQVEMAWFPGRGAHITI